MPNEIQKLNGQNLDQKHPLLFGSWSFFYLAALLAIIAAFGPSPILYVLFITLSAVFILPDRNYLGLILIAGLTMFFERYFTLTGLTIGEDIYKFYLLDAVLVFSFLALLYRLIRERTKIVFGWPEKILTVFLVMVALYLLRSLFDLNANFTIAFSSFKNYLVYPLIYFLTLYTINSREKLKSFVHTLLFLAAGLIVFILIGFVNGVGLWTEFTPLSTGGVRYLAGTHAFYMLLAALIGTSLFFYNRIRNSFLGLTLLGCWSFGIGVSLMRHLWLALAVGLAIIFALLEKNNKKKFIQYAFKSILVIINIAVIVILFSSLSYFAVSGNWLNDTVTAVSDRVLSLTELSADSSASWRNDLWYDAKNVWEQNPIFGVGFGKSILIDWGDFKNFEEIKNIHNSPLSITVQMGLLGIAIFGLFVLVSLISALRKIFADEDLKPYYLGLFAGVVIFLFVSLFQPYLETNLLSLWFWMFLGLIRTSDKKL
jgi:O-antigen ligase